MPSEATGTLKDRLDFRVRDPSACDGVASMVPAPPLSTVEGLAGTGETAESIVPACATARAVAFTNCGAPALFLAKGA